MAYKLSATLEGHEQDVRALVSPYNDTIVSASRDSTVRVWTFDNGLWNSKINFTSTGFVNSLAFDKENQLIISGGQDNLINVTELYSSGGDPKYVLIGHESNVCSLDYKNNQIISGSWDSTAKVWENYNLKYNLIGHNAAVWDVKILDDENYLTSSADRTIKLWSKNKEIKNIIGHTDVIRGLEVLENSFASTSNDGTIRITNFNGELMQELIGHDSFVYNVKQLSNGDLVSSGEDRTVRIWSQGRNVQVITLPCISVWSISILPNDDIVVGGSDSIIRIFTKDPKRCASAEEIEEFNRTIENLSLNSKQFDESQVKSKDHLNLPGSKEGQVIVVKSDIGINEAYQWNENNWIKIGEVVAGAANDSKKEFNGKKWDYVFDVDVKDGAPPLKLPYNLNENPYTAAERFLSENELPSSYVEEIVKFITDNTEGISLNQSTSNPYVDNQIKRIIPQLNYLSFDNDNSLIMLKGIKKFNELEDRKFSNEQLIEIENYLKDKKYNELLEISEFILENWGNKLVSFDLLRLIILKLNDPPKKLSEFLKIGLDKSNLVIYYMTLRMLANIFSNPKWGELIITDNLISTQILDLINEAEFNQDKNSVNISNAISTLILNYSIYTVKFKSLNLLNKLLILLNRKGFEIGKISSESAYRLSVSYGNLNYISSEIKFSPEFNHFKTQMLQSFNEERFQSVFKEI